MSPPVSCWEIASKHLNTNHLQSNEKRGLLPDCWGIVYKYLYAKDLRFFGAICKATKTVQEEALKAGFRQISLHPFFSSPSPTKPIYPKNADCMLYSLDQVCDRIRIYATEVLKSRRLEKTIQLRIFFLHNSPCECEVVLYNSYVPDNLNLKKVYAIFAEHVPVGEATHRLDAHIAMTLSGGPINITQLGRKITIRGIEEGATWLKQIEQTIRPKSM